MDQLLSSELNLIQDPEVGLALLTDCPRDEMPERERQFWQLQFAAMRDWLAGDGLAVARAVSDCSLFQRPPPYWLSKATVSLAVQHMSDDERRARAAMNKHWLRWKAVKLVRGQHPKDPRNFTKKVSGDAVWEEAAKLLTDTDVRVDPETVRRSYQLIKRAGGTQTTLPSYKREVEVRDRPRNRRRKKD